MLTRPIRWDLIRQQYDEMIKYATALRLGTADAESILRRFTRDAPQHPTYQALAELGKAVKTIFLCRYLHLEALRREIHEGLNVVENWNSASSFIFYGKGGEISTNRRDEQELAVLSLHLLQSSLVYINTLMLQHVLREPAWMASMTTDDLRGLTPLIYTHVNPYGAPRSAQRESSERREPCKECAEWLRRQAWARSRTASEALRTKRWTGALQPVALPARALLWVRKKVLSDASQDGPPARRNGRARVEVADRLLIWQVESRNDRLPALRNYPTVPPPSEATSRARRTGTPYGSVQTLSA